MKVTETIISLKNSKGNKEVENSNQIIPSNGKNSSILEANHNNSQSVIENIQRYNKKPRIL